MILNPNLSSSNAEVCRSLPLADCMIESRFKAFADIDLSELEEIISASLCPRQGGL
jgi:hypothetical protein